MINKTESQIMKNWQDKKQMMVSVTCVAFNHEYCIAEALDSFLMQETSFPFEIIINDDVSTDRTVEILKEYERQFPNIVKPVYQTENQFSQGINTMFLLFPFASGQYIAFCDGDDHWTDENKLEIQVAEMQKHPEIDMSFHSTYKLVNGERVEIMSRHAEKNTLFTPQQIILGGGIFCPTASLMFTRQFISSLPEWFYSAVPGDYVSQVMGAVKAGALYIDRCMSSYRVGVESSWTCTESSIDSEKRRQSLFDFTNKLHVINDTFNQKFQKEIDKVIHDESLDFIKTRGINVAIREEVYKLNKNTLSAKQKALWYLFYRNQNLLNVLKQVKYYSDSTLKYFN